MDARSSREEEMKKIEFISTPHLEILNTKKSFVKTLKLQNASQPIPKI